MQPTPDPRRPSPSGHPFIKAAPLALTRRTFLHTTAGAAFLGTLGPIGTMGHAMAADASFEPELVRFSDEIEPIVRLIEETPRDKIIDAAAQLLRSGTTYKPFMAALFLAGIRNVDSGNSGFGFHCVFVINSAHLLALDSPASERLLPFFWALDSFKAAQRSQPRKMKALAKDPPAGQEAIAALRAAIAAWDPAAAELALAGIARTCGAVEAFDELWRLGAKDIRPIGHKAIFVANTWRTLQTIGWQHAEPALRSLGRSLAGYGPTTQNNGIAFDDQCHPISDELVRAHLAQLPADWADDSTPHPGADAAMAAALLAPIRAANPKQACTDAVTLLLAKGEHATRARAGAIWDVVHLAAAEFMLRRPGIVSVHAVTSVNALHFAFKMARAPETRLFILLQGVGWMAHFASISGLSRQENPGPSILDLAAADIPGDPAAAAESILAQVGTSRNHAACAAFAYAQRHEGKPALLAGARRLVYTKATEAHEYKYPAAAFEDISIVSPTWRPHMLAASTLYLPAAKAPDSALIQRAKEAIAGL